MEKQFDEFRLKLEESGILREKIRAVSMEMESAIGLMQSDLLMYYRYHGDWRTSTQTVVSLVAFLHWLETGDLLMHSETEEKLGLVNQVTAGDYHCPRKVLKFLTDLHAAFRMLNLRNDFLRKKFDGMKYDLRRVEEVYYDVKIRGLMSIGDSTKDQKTEAKFDEFRLKLEESGILREKIRTVSMEMESAIGIMQSDLLMVHQSRPIPEILEKAKVQIDVLKKLYGVLAVILKDYLGQYYSESSDSRRLPFRMLNLRNDFLRKKFDGMKYDLRRVEEVYYDVKIRGLMTIGDSTEDQEKMEAKHGIS
ncbi:Translin [Thalictrum thalictroides]|uniref:Translin n=1 Tax=Thalictrum thalictroides TaxID=46969 RepID=A0A7J6WUW3_THATH|nr:Translin [Thalictrum thalictroides]